MEGERRGARAPDRATPTLVASVAGALGAGALVIYRHPVWAGIVALVAAVALVWGWFFAHQAGDPRSHLAAMLADPVFDTSLLGAIAWAWRQESVRVSVLALVCLGLTYIASYERARSDALGYRTFEGLGYRVARAALIVAGLVSSQEAVALWLLAGLAAVAVVVRATNVALQERRATRAET
jgi:hypothetical protein